jgi:hypothetical protein
VAQQDSISRHGPGCPQREKLRSFARRLADHEKGSALPRRAITCRLTTAPQSYVTATLVRVISEVSFGYARV